MLGEEVAVASYDKKTFRVSEYYGIKFSDDIQSIYRQFPHWGTDRDDGGSVAFVLNAGIRLAMWRTPTASYIERNPAVHFSGWRNIKSFDTANDAEVTEKIRDIPQGWHYVLIQGALKWVLEGASAPQNKIDAAFDKFEFQKMEMSKKCVPARGFGTLGDQILPGEAFTRGIGGSGTGGGYDYGLTNRRG